VGSIPTRLFTSLAPARRRWAAALVLAAAVLAFGLTGCGSPNSRLAEAVSQQPAPGSRPLLVVQSPEGDSWLRLLRAGGLAAIEEPFGYLPTDSAAVVPDDLQLTGSEVAEVKAWVRAGGRLVTADPMLLGHLGGRLSEPVPATGATMAGLPGSATWASTTQVQVVNPPAGSAIGTATAQAQSGEGALPISVRWAYGKGQVLGLGVDPMGSGRTGYELLPTLSRLVGEATMAPAGPSRNGLELYLDPGVLPPNIERNVNAVAALAQGARVVDVAAWDTNFTDPSRDYPYAALIQALHARGILAYAWLEPPFVDLAMWQNQPQCREKTETGQDADPYWRDLISLETPACFNLAWQHWTPVIEGNSWDGVNVAELYFESPQAPAAFTPFSPGALKLFGRDPRTDMAAFMKFRVQLVTELNGEMLTRLNSLPHASALDLELTVIDSKLDPTEAYDVGSDVTQLAAVAQKGGASLQVEDPFTTWSDGPLRYDQLTPELRQLVQPGNGLIDLNVVNRSGARPTAKMTGGELNLAAASAAAFSGRMGAYAIGTIPAADQADLPAAMAGSAQTTYTGIVTPWTVTVNAPPGGADTSVTVDGTPWPSARGAAVVPAGEHRIVWSDSPAPGPGLVGFTGEVSSATVGARAMTLAYSSRAATYAVVTQRPVTLVVDGAAQTAIAVANPTGGWTLHLPKGTHRVNIGF
jgi:hypothetical protein